MVAYAKIAVDLECRPIGIEDLVLIRYSVDAEHLREVAWKRRFKSRSASVRTKDSATGLTEDDGVTRRARYLAKVSLSP